MERAPREHVPGEDEEEAHRGRAIDEREPRHSVPTLTRIHREDRGLVERDDEMPGDDDERSNPA